MSVSATTAAKRRRAGIQVGASPMFKSGAPSPQVTNLRPPQVNTLPPNTAPVTNNSRPSTQPVVNEIARVDMKKPMPLQQVISVLDNRILYLESNLINQTKDSQLINTDELASRSVSSSTFTQEAIEDMVVNTIKNHMAEFDHRYELLAGEIVNLKEIVLQLQSYTLDVNKTLLEDRDHLMEIANRSVERESIAIKQIQELKESFANMELQKVALTADAEAQVEAQVDAQVEAESEVEAQVEAQVEAEVEVEVEVEAEAEAEVEAEAEHEEVEDREEQSIQLEDQVDKKKGKRKAKGKNVMQLSLDDIANSNWSAISTGQ